MKCLYLILFLLAIPARAEDENPYCKEQEFTLMTPSIAPNLTWQEMKLASEEEMKDPEIFRKLAFRPGRYGHSELGYRYLARVLGYPGKFNAPDAVENWIAETQNPAFEKGLWALWDKWVKNPVKRLSVPTGAYRDVANNGDPARFYKNARDRKNHLRCIQGDMGKLSCETFSHLKIHATDQVYFNPKYYGTLQKTCLVSMRARPLTEQAPDTESYDENRTVNMELNGLNVSSKRTWTRKNRVSRDTASGNSGNADSAK